MSVDSTWTYRETPSGDLTGYSVEASDAHVGKIDAESHEAGSSYVVVDTGWWIFGTKRLIPAGAIAQVDAANETVYLSMTKEQVDSAPDYDAAEWNDETRDRYGEYYGPYTGGAVGGAAGAAAGAGAAVPPVSGDGYAETSGAYGQTGDAYTDTSARVDDLTSPPPASSAVGGDAGTPMDEAVDNLTTPPPPTTDDAGYGTRDDLARDVVTEDVVTEDVTDPARRDDDPQRPLL